MSFDELLDELAARRERALAMGGPAKLAERRDAGLLNARERVERLLDPGTFVESGLLGVSSVVPEDRECTPADGKVTGFGQIAGRPVAVISNDFTVKGASSSLTNMKKIAHVKRVATARGLPIVFLGESSGARMPDTMGAWGMGTLLATDPAQYQRLRKTPWVSAVLGQCYGSSAWYACLSDCVVMRRGAVMAVGSPHLASLAIGERVEPEELGGATLHAEVTGLVDRVVETDAEALDALRAFLDYLPSHHAEPPPRRAVPDGSDEAAARVLGHLPESRTRGYDVRRVVRDVLDRDSFFELKERFGRAAVTGLGRLGGRSVGVIANNPLFRAGALDAPACQKITSLLVLCDSFNVPLITFVDTPGFMIGQEAERQAVAGKIMNWMNALQLCTVPRLTVILRKSYGQAYINMGGGRNSDDVAAWPTAEVSFMDPAYAARIVAQGARDAADPAELEATLERMRRDSGVWDLAATHAIQAVIRPEDTRAHLLRQLEIHELRLTGGVGQHRLRAWPTSH